MQNAKATHGKYLGARLPKFSKSHCITPTFHTFCKKNGHAKLSLKELQELNLSKQAHRALVQIKGGEIGESDSGEPLKVLHMCGNSSCVNDEHLQLGTNEQNMRDATFHERNVPFFLGPPSDVRVVLIKLQHAEGVEYDCPKAVAISSEVSPVERNFSAFHPKKCYHSRLENADPHKLRRILYCIFFGKPTDFSHKDQAVHTTCNDYACINVFHFKELERHITSKDEFPHANSRLTFGQIEEIRTSKLPSAELANTYGVHKTTIDRHRPALSE